MHSQAIICRWSFSDYLIMLAGFLFVENVF